MSFSGNNDGVPPKTLNSPTGAVASSGTRCSQSSASRMFQSTHCVSFCSLRPPLTSTTGYWQKRHL